MRQTSVESYNFIRESGALSKLRWTVYDYIYNKGPSTQREVVLALSQEKESNGTFSSRFSELKRLGLLSEVGTTECKFTGRKVLLWDVTDKLPRVITRREQLEEQISNTRAKLLRLETELSELGDKNE